jgi:hypothetical protein
MEAEKRRKLNLERGAGGDLGVGFLRSKEFEEEPLTGGFKTSHSGTEF